MKSYSNQLQSMLAPYIIVGVLWIPLSKLVENFTNDLLIGQLLIDCLGTLIVFIQSVFMKNSSVYDPYWHVVPMFFTAYWAWSGSNKLLALICYFYCTKQNFTYFRFWPGFSYEDYRYLEFQNKFRSNKNFYWVFSLLAFHVFPTFQVYLGYIPLYYLITDTSSKSETLHLIGILLSIVAVIIQWVADWQLYPYRTKQIKGDCETGIWNYCRHPNYFGECLFWWGQYVAVLSYGFHYFWTGLGALAIQLMFLLYSIPNMEQHLLIKRPSYKKYQREVSCFVPWFRKQNGIKD